MKNRAIHIRPCIDGIRFDMDDLCLVRLAKDATTGHLSTVGSAFIDANEARALRDELDRVIAQIEADTEVTEIVWRAA